MPVKKVGRTSRSAADLLVGFRPTHEAEVLARELFEARRELRNAGCALHDQAGSLLSAAGLRLQLLRMDFPEAARAVDQVLVALDEAMERVRALSQALNPSPAAHLGLQAALSQLVERRSASFSGIIRLTYKTVPQPPPDAAVAIYDAVAATLERAVQDRTATSIQVTVSGTGNLAVRVASNGRWKWSRREAAAEARRARPAGLTLGTTKKGTLVSIKYALRRAPRG
jgi:signal transduction histidine kinase